MGHAANNQIATFSCVHGEVFFLSGILNKFAIVVLTPRVTCSRTSTVRSARHVGTCNRISMGKVLPQKNIFMKQWFARLSYPRLRPCWLGAEFYMSTWLSVYRENSSMFNELNDHIYETSIYEPSSLAFRDRVKLLCHCTLNEY